MTIILKIVLNRISLAIRTVHWMDHGISMIRKLKIFCWNIDARDSIMS